ncbi:putative DNA binding domain-containing protein [Candidatus Micrarchaeota archaeon]|nr:putative DNA binding domain-containing protein [Candidatus Micrarchaeota archaeon]
MAQLTAQEVVEDVIRGGTAEGYSIDWAEGTKNPNSLGEKIAAFATSAGGCLIIGLDNDRVVQGIGDKQALISQVGDVLRNCQPIPPVGEPEFVEKDGKLLAVYRIPSLGGTICEYKEVAYHRVQDSVKKMTAKEIMHRLTLCGPASWEERPSIADVEEIDKEELEYCLKKIQERNPLEPKTSENFLRSGKAITKDGKNLTNLGLIALAQKPSEFIPQCKIQLVRFRGTQPVDRIAAYLVELPARKAIETCMNFLRLNLPVRERHEGAARMEEPIIPERALREAVVNMVVHRDYNDPQESLVRIFDDRVELQNSGAPEKEELIRIISQGIPFHRNQGVYNFLRPVHQAEAAGQGIPIMKRELGRVGLTEPVITTLYNIFHLKMGFGKKEESLEERVIAYGMGKKKLSTTDVMKKCEISRPTAIYVLDEIVRKGVARHFGKRRNSHYVF